MSSKSLIKMILLFVLISCFGCTSSSSEGQNTQNNNLTLSEVSIWPDPNQLGRGYLRLAKRDGNPVSAKIKMLFQDEKMPVTVSIPLLNTGIYPQIVEFSFPEGNILEGAVLEDIQSLDCKNAFDDLEITNYLIPDVSGLEYIVNNKGNKNIWFIGQTLNLGEEEDGTLFSYYGESEPVLVHPSETITVQAFSGNPNDTGTLLIGCYAQYE